MSPVSGFSSFATLLATALVATAGPLGAQEEVDALLSGTLFVSGVPADTGTVVLHRVSPEEASEIDSTTVAEDGAFSFRLPNLPVPGSGEVFFASTRFDGILYPGGYVSDPIQLDSLYAIRAFRSRTLPPEGRAFPVSRREVWINEGPLGWEVTDVLEIQNPDSTTLVAAENGAVWRYPLPAGAISPRVLNAGPVVGATRFDGSTLVAANPLVPTANYYIVQYDLDSIEFDLPMPGETGLMQLLVREPAPAMRVEGLARQPDQEIEVGSTFLFWAGEALFNQNIAVRLGEAGRSRDVVWLVAALSFLLVAVGSWVVRRERPGLTPAPASVGSSAGRMRKDILVELAKLDEEHARLGEPDPGVTEYYRRRRAELADELRRAGRPETPSQHP